MRRVVAVLALILAPLAGLLALVLIEMSGRYLSAPAPAVDRMPQAQPDPIPPSESARVDLACGPRRPETPEKPERVTRAPRTRILASPEPSAGQDRATRSVVPPSQVTVQLVSAVDGTPIAHTPVRIGYRDRGKTDAAGRLTFDGRGYRATRLRLDGYPTVRIPLPDTGESRGTEVRVFRIEPPGILQGTVLGARGEAPDGGRVRASLDEPTSFRDHEELGYVGKFLATVDGAGRFRLEGVPVRTPFRVQVTARNAPTKRLAYSYRIEPGIVTTLHVRLAPCGVVRGRVLDQYGRGVPAAAVRFVGSGHPSPGWSSPATTDASGEFILRGVPLGPGRIRASPEVEHRYTRFGFPPAFVPMHLATHAEVAGTVIRVHCGHIVEGRVVGPDGRGVEGAWVSAPGSWRWSPTGENGDFRIGPFPPGKVMIRAISPDRTRVAPAVQVDSDVRGVVLRLVKRAQIAGRVLLDGALPGGTVFASARGRNGLEATGIRMDGTFEFKRLEPGSYDLWAVATDGRVGGREGVRVEQGGAIENVRIRVDQTCTVEVRLTGPGFTTKHRRARVRCDVYRNGQHLFQTGLEPPRMRTSVPPGPIELDLVLVHGVEGLAELRRSAVLRPGETLRIDWPVPERRPGAKHIDVRSRFSRIRRNARW